MPAITLPDGSQRTFEQEVTVMDVAADIGPGLAKATLAGEVDGVLRDASHVIETMPPCVSLPAGMTKGLKLFATRLRT